MSLRGFAHPAGLHNATPPRVVFGPGSVAGLRDEVARLGARRALVLSTAGRGALAAQLASDIGDRCVGVLAEAVSQVPIELAEAGQAAAARLGADCLVAVGGGAATGFAKGISYAAGLPIIAVPTTYSGSEMTGYCGMTINGVKLMHESPAMLARTVIYDAELSRSLPARVSAASAMNALAHCIDAIYLPSLSPLLAPAAVEGARVVTSVLPTLLKDPDDLVARNEMLYGAYLAGAALTGGFAIQHAIAHMLGGSFGIEHGTAHALVLPYVTAHLLVRAPQPMSRIALALGTEDLAGHLWDVIAGAGLPVRLADAGLGDHEFEQAVHIATAAEHAAPDAAAGTGTTGTGTTGGARTAGPDPDKHNADRPGNPAPVTEASVRAILAAARDGRRP